ncbi:MAG TPA: hypothetical protein VM347_39565 [Nonomuraea sp.]|nr:hypothetical protein [Nonomuraea sp.]
MKAGKRGERGTELIHILSPRNQEVDVPDRKLNTLEKSCARAPQAVSDVGTYSSHGGEHRVQRRSDVRRSEKCSMTSSLRGRGCDMSVLSCHTDQRIQSRPEQFKQRFSLLRSGDIPDMDLTADSIPIVSAAIREYLAQNSTDLTGVSCIARGADSLFAAAVLDITMSQAPQPDRLV